MKFKKITFIIFLFVSTLNIYAKEINISTIKFQIDDEFKVLEENSLLFYAEKPDAFIAIKSTDPLDFDRKIIMNSLDSIWFNLKDSKRLKSKKEYFFQWAKDYSTKYYTLDNGHHVITHTFYTNNKPYCLYANYKSKEDEKLIKSVIDSIEPNVNLFDRVLLAYDNAPIYWIVFMILLCIVGLFQKEDKEHGRSIFKSLLVTWTIVFAILYFTTGGMMLIFIPAILISITFFLLAYFAGMYLTFDTD